MSPRRHVRVYIEGGAAGKTADADFRRAWKKFLQELHEIARSCGYQSLEVVRGKGRGRAFSLFRSSPRSHPKDLCVLLADSESEVCDGAQVWKTVEARDGDNWQRPSWATEKHLYLMVVMAETWLLTDTQALSNYFKGGFNVACLPTVNLEGRSKREIEQALVKATSGCGSRRYRHGQANEIIEFVRPERVKCLKYGARLFEELRSLIESQG